MAVTNHERVGKAMDLLKQGLAPFVEREFKNSYKDKAATEGARFVGEDRLLSNKPVTEWDAAALLKFMWEAWNNVFRRTLGPAERSLLSELRDHRNKWAHQQSFSSDDAYRALDSVGRLLTAVSAPQADEIEKMKMELLRLRFDEQVRTEKRKSAGTAIESTAAANLKPWREVVTPHKDVASGRSQQADEQCAHLHQIVWRLERHRFPPQPEAWIPTDGLYFVFETGETGHGGDRIVRIGSHTGKGNLAARLKEHTTHNKDRSIFRKNIGRALLSRDHDPFLETWDLDLTKRDERARYQHLVDPDKQNKVEQKVSAHTQKCMSLAVIGTPVEASLQKTNRLKHHGSWVQANPI